LSKSFHRLLLVMAFMVSPALAGTPSTMTTFVLRAWTPGLGAPVPASPFESELLTVVSDVRHGSFAAAERKLEQLENAAASPRERLLLLFFRKQLLYEQYDGAADDQLDVAGALFLTDAAKVSETIDHRYDALLAGDSSPLTRDGHGLLAAHVIVRMLVRLPSAGRSVEFARQMGDQPSAYVARENVMTIVSSIRQLGVGMKRGGLLSDADFAAIERLADAARFLGSGWRDEVVCVLEQVLASAPEEARADVMIALGDAYAFPDGSPFFAGTDIATAETQVLAVMMRMRLRRITPAMPGDLERALAWYDSAEAVDANADVAVRRAFAGILTGREESAAELQELAGRLPADRAARSAGAILGVTANLHDAFRAAISGAVAARDFGSLASFAAMARMIASRNFAGDAPTAVVILESTSESLRAAGFPRIAVSLLEDLAFLYHHMGRADASIVRTRIAQEAVTAHLAELERRGAGPDALELDRNALQSLRAAAEMPVEDAALDGRTVAAPTTPEVKAEGESIDGTAGLFSAEVNVLIERLNREIPLHKELTEKTEEIFRGDTPCAERLALLAPYRQRAVDGGLRDWLLRFDVVNAVCDPAQLERTRRELEQEDVVAPVERRAAALAAAEKADGNDYTMLNDELGRAMLGLDVLRYARAWESLDRFASRLQRALKSIPRSAPSLVDTQLLIAEARLGLGRHEEALILLDAIISNPQAWGKIRESENVTLFVIVLQGLMARCECGEPSCEPATMLHTRELIELHRVAWRVERTGVTPSDRESAGVAATERRLAIADAIPADDATSVQQARSRSLGITIHDLTGGLNQGDIGESLEALPNGTTALIYYRTFSGVIGWKVRNGRVEVRKLSASAAEIEKDAALLQRSVVDPLEGDWVGPAARLYAVLVQPFEPLVPGETLVVSALGTLGLIPFEVLGLDDGDRLVRRNPIVYALRFGGTEDRLATTGKGALVAAVNGDGLAHAEQEAATVAALLGTQPITGRDVNAATLSSGLRAARYVHLAVHGVLVPENPFQSHLLLASGERFEAWRMFRDAPSAEIIVLSACDMRSEPNTLSGDAARAGESMTFTAFALAGNARYVLGSAWRANDLVAERVTAAFWENIVVHGYDAPHALQRAKTALLAVGITHPHYFANFVLSARSIVAAADER
jgi:CHAT domain-containing protein